MCVPMPVLLPVPVAEPVPMHAYVYIRARVTSERTMNLSFRWAYKSMYFIFRF